MEILLLSQNAIGEGHIVFGTLARDYGYSLE